MIIPVNEARLDDASMVHAVSWQESHRSFCDAAFVERHDAAHQKEYIRKKMADGSAFYLLLEEDRPVGVVSVLGGLIEDLYVLPAEQNRGYGTRLLHFAMERCDSAPTLWILENNANAERFYRRNGFRPTGRRNHITAKLDEIEFALRAADTSILL
jgi:GNAT superfamily N-acetyltransferase